MTLYLLHIEPPYKQAKHYLGFTPDEDPARRVAEHLSGGCKASPLIKAALKAGHTVTHVRTMEGSRTDERRIKNKRNTPRLCPCCREKRSTSKVSQAGACQFQAAAIS